MHMYPNMFAFARLHVYRVDVYESQAMQTDFVRLKFAWSLLSSIAAACKVWRSLMLVQARFGFLNIEFQTRCMVQGLAALYLSFSAQSTTLVNLPL